MGFCPGVTTIHQREEAGETVRGKKERNQIRHAFDMDASARAGRATRFLTQPRSPSARLRAYHRDSTRSTLTLRLSDDGFFQRFRVYQD